MNPLQSVFQIGAALNLEPLERLVLIGVHLKPCASITQLAAFTALSARSVKRHLATLERAGVLLVSRQVGRRNTYVLRPNYPASGGVAPKGYH